MTAQHRMQKLALTGTPRFARASIVKPNIVNVQIDQNNDSKNGQFISPQTPDSGFSENTKVHPEVVTTGLAVKSQEGGDYGTASVIHVVEPDATGGRHLWHGRGYKVDPYTEGNPSNPIKESQAAKEAKQNALKGSIARDLYLKAKHAEEISNKQDKGIDEKNELHKDSDAILTIGETNIPNGPARLISEQNVPFTVIGADEVFKDAPVPCSETKRESFAGSKLFAKKSTNKDSQRVPKSNINSNNKTSCSGVSANHLRKKESFKSVPSATTNSTKMFSQAESAWSGSKGENKDGTFTKLADVGAESRRKKCKSTDTVGHSKIDDNDSSKIDGKFRQFSANAVNRNEVSMRDSNIKEAFTSKNATEHDQVGKTAINSQNRLNQKPANKRAIKTTSTPITCGADLDRTTVDYVLMSNNDSSTQKTGNKKPGQEASNNTIGTHANKLTNKTSLSNLKAKSTSPSPKIKRTQRSQTLKHGESHASLPDSVTISKPANSHFKNRSKGARKVCFTKNTDDDNNSNTEVNNKDVSKDINALKMDLQVNKNIRKKILRKNKVDTKPTQRTIDNNAIMDVAQANAFSGDYAEIDRTQVDTDSENDSLVDERPSEKENKNPWTIFEEQLKSIDDGSMVFASKHLTSKSSDLFEKVMEEVCPQFRKSLIEELVREEDKKKEHSETNRRKRILNASSKIKSKRNWNLVRKSMLEKKMDADKHDSASLNWSFLCTTITNMKDMKKGRELLYQKYIYNPNSWMKGFTNKPAPLLKQSFRNKGKELNLKHFQNANGQMTVCVGHHPSDEEQYSMVRNTKPRAQSSRGIKVEPYIRPPLSSVSSSVLEQK